MNNALFAKVMCSPRASDDAYYKWKKSACCQEWSFWDLGRELVDELGITMG